MFDEIYLDTDEEVTSAIDKVKKSPKNNVALFLPRNALLGQSIVNLKLLYKEATAAKKEIGLITPDPTARALAQKIGFSAFASVGEIDFSHLPVEPKEKKPAMPKPKLATNPPAGKSSPAKPAKPDSDDSALEEGMVIDEPAPPAAKAGLSAAGFTTHALDGVMPDPHTSSPKSPPSASPEPSQPLPQKSSPPPPPPPAGAEEPVAAASGGSTIPTSGNLRFFRPKPRRRSFVLPVVSFLLILAGGAIAAGFLLPKADVTLTLDANPLTSSVKSSVSLDATSIDANNAVIPGKLVSVTQDTNSSAKATGKKDIGTKATGTANFLNAWDSNPHTFPAGTSLTAKNGNVYVTTQDVTVPGASSTISAGQTSITPGEKDGIPIQASDSGTQYNSDPTIFTIGSIANKAEQEKLYAQSDAAITGGTSQLVTVVTQADIDNLTTAVKSQNHDDLVAKLKSQAGNSVVIDKAIQIVSQDATPSVAADTQADSVEVTVSGSAKVITFSKDDYNQLVQKMLANQIPQGQHLVSSGDGIATTDTSQYELNLVDDKHLELNNDLKAFTVGDFDENEIKFALYGGNPKDIKTLIGNKLPVEDAQVTISPSWFPRIPYNSKNIHIAYAYKAKAGAPPAPNP